MDSDYSSNSPLLRYVRPMVIECDNGLHVVPTEAMYTALRNSLSAEQLATSDGKQLEFDFDVTEMAAGGAGTDDISTYANNHDYTIGKFFDLTLIVKADGVPIGTITATAAAIPISVDVPATLQKAGRTFIVLKNHNGDISEVGRGTGTSVPISTDSFSTYAIAYSDNIAAPVNPANPTSSNNGSGIIGNAFDLLALYSQSPSSSSTTGHIHNYVWKTDANGNMYYVCTSCGDIAGEKLVPSGYAQFQKDTTEKIKAATGNTVTIKTDIWISFHKSVIEELAQHPELSLTIEYRRDGKRYSTTIPAGYDVRSLLNDEGYVGFLYLNTKFGRTELN